MATLRTGTAGALLARVSLVRCMDVDTLAQGSLTAYKRGQEEAQAMSSQLKYFGLFHESDSRRYLNMLIVFL